MGNESSSLQRQFWLLAQKGDAKALRTALEQLTSETRSEFLEWTDPQDRWTPLAIATLNGYVASARDLLAAGAHADAKGVGGRTPLQLAINRDNAELVRVLIAGGADVNALDPRGQTPLLLAVRLGSHASVKELINTPEIDMFACDAFSGMDAFKSARHAYGEMGFSNRLNHKKCLELIEKKLLIRLGWIFEASESPRIWTKRYYMVFRTADLNAVKIDVFDVKPGGRPPPSLQLVYHASDRIQAIAPVEDQDRDDDQEFRFRFHGCKKNQSSTPKVFEFAALNQVEFEFWTSFPTSWQTAEAVAPVNDLVITESISSRAVSPQQQLQLQNQRTLEAVMQLLTLEELRPAAACPTESSAFQETTSSSQCVRLDLPNSPSAGRKSSESCVVCYDGPQSVVCVPCGHITMCVTCANQVMNSTCVCPVCRMDVREIVKIFRV